MVINKKKIKLENLEMHGLIIDGDNAHAFVL